MIYCSNCQKARGHKRALGWGTFFMVVLTLGLWILVIPFYPKRCMICGQKYTVNLWTALPSNEKKGVAVAVLSIVLIIVMVGWYNSYTSKTGSQKIERVAPARIGANSYDRQLINDIDEKLCAEINREVGIRLDDRGMLNGTPEQQAAWIAKYAARSGRAVRVNYWKPDDSLDVFEYTIVNGKTHERKIAFYLSGEKRYFRRDEHGDFRDSDGFLWHENNGKDDL